MLLFDGEAWAQAVTAKGTTQWRSYLAPEIQQTTAAYSFSPTQSIGITGLRIDKGDADVHRLIGLVEYAHLLKRWYGEDYQANIYAGAGIGGGAGDFDGSEPAGSAFLQADWETRRWFAMASLHDYVGQSFNHLVMTGQVAWAPYKADYQDLATWFVLQAEYITETDARLRITPMLRFMKGNYFVEVGSSLMGEPQLNFRITF